MDSRTFVKARLVFFVVLLLAWVAWLGNQAFTRGRFPVVSHAQLLVSTLDVVADVTSDAEGKAAPSIVVREVLWPKGKETLIGKSVEVVNLPVATLPNDRSYHEPGRYILPLVSEGDKFAVAGLPRSPAFPDRAHYIYPDTGITRQQLAGIPKP